MEHLEGSEICVRSSQVAIRLGWYVHWCGWPALCKYGTNDCNGRPRKPLDWDGTSLVPSQSTSRYLSHIQI
jgi:hypothetical protein